MCIGMIGKHKTRLLSLPFKGNPINNHLLSTQYYLSDLSSPFYLGFYLLQKATHASSQTDIPLVELLHNATGYDLLSPSC